MRTAKAKAAFLAAKQDLSPDTLKQYISALKYLEKECPKLLNKPDILRNALNQIKSVWVRDAYWRVWRIFFRWCRLEYGTAYSMRRVERPKVPTIEMRSLELEELSRVLAAASNLRDRAIVTLALDSGIRAGEFGRLRVEDLGRRTVRVWGKGNKQTSIPISSETHHLLEVLVGVESRYGYLFWGHKGPLTRHGVYRVVRQCMDRAGILGNKRGSHCLRHSLGKNYIVAGGDAFSLQRIMRHSDIATTLKYVHLAMEDVLRQHHRYSPLRRLRAQVEMYRGPPSTGQDSFGAHRQVCGQEAD